MSEILDILQIGAGVGLFCLGKIVVTSGRKLWWTGLVMAVVGYWTVLSVFCEVKK